VFVTFMSEEPVEALQRLSGESMSHALHTDQQLRKRTLITGETQNVMKIRFQASQRAR
jgi:hypothetical protein